VKSLAYRGDNRLQGNLVVANGDDVPAENSHRSGHTAYAIQMLGVVYGAADIAIGQSFHANHRVDVGLAYQVAEQQAEQSRGQERGRRCSNKPV
jgi:hypothetical protein